MNVVQTQAASTTTETARDIAEQKRATGARRPRREAERQDALRAANVIVSRIQARAAAARPAQAPVTRALRKRARVTLPPLTMRDVAIEEATATVDAPYQPGAKETVTVNRRVDILETERATKRISEAAFLTGRQIQAVFERAAGVSSPSGPGTGERVDTDMVADLPMIRGVVNAQAVRAEMERITKAVGEVGARFLREVLTGTTFAQYAERRGRGGERGTSYVAERFRWLLEEVAEFRAARGRA